MGQKHVTHATHLAHVTDVTHVQGNTSTLNLGQLPSGYLT